MTKDACAISKLGKENGKCHVASSSRDCTIRAWDLDAGFKMKIASNHD